MGAINVSAGTYAKATLKLYNQLTSYLFEEECDELRRYASQTNINSLKAAQKALGKIIERARK